MIALLRHSVSLIVAGGFVRAAYRCPGIEGPGKAPGRRVGNGLAAVSAPSFSRCHWTFPVRRRGSRAGR